MPSACSMQEMRALGSLIMAQATRIGAGRIGAGGRPRRLLPRRDRAIAAHPNIEIVRERSMPCPTARRSSPPARSPPPARRQHRRATGSDALAFFDAIAPIVHHDSIDMDIAWRQARWNKGGARTTSTAR
jgi:methylenetetrahydrofolate--tRNA-(uracil-5-)-methyltransferase